jgi:hypothetical protein
MVFRYVLEELSEAELLEIDQGEPVANTSVTRYVRGDGGSFRLIDYNAVPHLAADEHDAGAPVTEENDVPSPA